MKQSGPLYPGAHICFFNNGNCHPRYGVVIPASPLFASYVLVHLNEDDEENKKQLVLFTVVPRDADIIECEF